MGAQPGPLSWGMLLSRPHPGTRGSTSATSPEQPETQTGHPWAGKNPNTRASRYVNIQHWRGLVVTAGFQGAGAHPVC